MKAEEQPEAQEETKPLKFTLVRLFPKDIPKFWPLIKKCYIDDWTKGVPLTEEIMMKVLQFLSKGYSVVWAVKDSNQDVYGFCTTSINKDPLTDTFCLYFQNVSIFRILPRRGWESCMEVFKKYAKDAGCVSIQGRTMERQAKLYKRLGFNTETRVVIYDLQGD